MTFEKNVSKEYAEKLSNFFKIKQHEDATCESFEKEEMELRVQTNPDGQKIFYLVNTVFDNGEMAGFQLTAEQLYAIPLLIQQMDLSNYNEEDMEIVL